MGRWKPPPSMAAMEAVMMIRPPLPWAIICLAAALPQRKAPFRLTEMTCSNSSSDCSIRGSTSPPTPALEMKMSRLPKRSTVAATRASTWALWETSVTQAMAEPPFR